MARCIIAGILTTYAIAVLQSTIAGRLAVWRVAPDLLFVWTVCVGLLYRAGPGALVGWGSGLLEGALQQRWIGAYAVSKTISGFLAGHLGTKMFKENWLVPLVCAGLLTLVNEAGFLLLSRGGVWPAAGRVVGVRVLYHAALAPFALAAVRRGHRLLMRGREEQA